MIERKPLIYISGPYTKPDPVTNLKRALKRAEEIHKMGLVAFVPHLTMFWDLVHRHDYNTWLEMDLQYLLRCDGLLRFSGESPGAEIEIAEARRSVIPVFYSIQEIKIAFL